MNNIFYNSNPYIAFPLGFGDMKSQTAVADIFLEEKKVWLNIRIEAIGYDDYTKQQVKRGGSIDRVFPGITKSMGRLPDDLAFWLYCVTVSATYSPHHQSCVFLPEKDGEIKVEWFDDFYKVLHYCEENYGIPPSHFKKISSGS